MHPRKFIVVFAVMLTALAVPAAAQAACDRPGVTVTAAQNTVLVGEQVDYSYQLCFNSTPDRYDVQVFQIAVNGDGEITSQQPVTSAVGQSISGRVSPVTGTGRQAATQTGDYLIRVRYFAAGRASAESVGEATWHVDPPRTQTSTPPTPQVPPTPAPTLDPAPSHSTPVMPLAAPQPQPQGQPQKAKLTLTKRAERRTVRPRQRARFTLTVRNTGKTAALGVKVCDRIPARTQYVSASRKVTFTGSSACVKIGTLRAGKSARVTITLLVDRTAGKGRIVNRAVATASNAPQARAAAAIRVPHAATPRVKAPVTG